MRMVLWKIFHKEFLLLFCHFDHVLSIIQFAIKGSNVELICIIRSTDKVVLWLKETTGLSEGTNIYTHVKPDEFRQRLSITGNHNNGDYHLTIATVKDTDEGMYSCTLPGVAGTHQVQLSVIEGPTSTSIGSKTQDNKLVGTVEEDLTINCTATDGNPLPDMVLQVKNYNYSSNGQGTIQKILKRVDRTYDGSTVKCLAGSQSLSYFPAQDTATIYLKWKPSVPTFSPDPVVIEETKPLSVTCTSIDGRPSVTERKWTIGNTDVTSQSTLVSSSPTNTISSTLTYSVDRKDNGKSLFCGFQNGATGNSFILSNRTMNIKFAPSVSVKNKTFYPSNSIRQVNCVADGNPTSYTFFKWQHKSKYGTVIRNLEGNSTLTLPTVPEEIRYQDTGEYVCTVSNGIKDKGGNVRQHASGYVVSLGPPVYLNGDQQTKLGQTKNNVEINVSVYSIPKYTSLKWTKGSNKIPSPPKTTTKDVPTVMNDIFNGTKVQIDGYILTLMIQNLEEQDFGNYTLNLRNGVGQSVEHMVILLSASSPDIPTNFTLIGATESAITLQWLPAYDGGHEQTFIVEYQTLGSSNWRKKEVPRNLHSAEADLQTYTLSGLQGGTTYEIRLYAENKYNQSDFTDIVIVSTLESSKQGAGEGAVIGAVVGVLAVVIVIVVIVVVMVVRRRNDSDAKKRSESVSEGEEGLKDNILYKSVDTRMKTMPVEYAEVQKPNDLYAEVKKPKPQKDTKNEKPKVTKSPGKKKRKQKAINNNSAAEEYTNQSEYANAGNPTVGYKNSDGLQYADLTFSNPPKTKTLKSVIHGLDERTIYCDVDHTKKAPPPPQEGAYELTEVSQRK